ncbi:MAG: SDR family oxidoreductase [Pseudomonadota bacterium]
MKTVLITGASQGIGAAVAELFWAQGWHVGLVARRASVLADLAKGKAATVLPADVTDAGSVQAAFDQFTNDVGHLDVVFNNAGMFGPSGSIDAVAVDDFDQVMSVNVRGMFLVAQAAFRHMRNQTPQGGRIINNGSISAHSPRAGSVCYTTSKHAISGMTKSIALDGRPFNIASGQIDIGNAETAMVTDLNDRRVSGGQDPLPTMSVDAAAQAVVHMAQLPLEANVQNMTILATQMPFVGRG